jgi:hypothetical protein
MFTEEVFAEVFLEVAPDGVDVVVVVLGVVVFQEERWALNHVVMALAFFDAASPGEAHFLDASLGNLFKVSFRYIGAVAEYVGLDELD